MRQTVSLMDTALATALGEYLFEFARLTGKERFHVNDVIPMSKIDDPVQWSQYDLGELVSNSYPMHIAYDRTSGWFTVAR